jgi:hypothetical protein
MTLNLERAVLMMARVEFAALSGQHDQRAWYVIHTEKPVPSDLIGVELDEIVDDETGEVQGYGTCGTARCAAGWALHDSPARLHWTRDLNGTTLRADYTTDGVQISDAACEWLGIEPPEDRVDPERGEEDQWGTDPRWDYEEDMPRLFAYDNSINDLYAYLAQWWEEDLSDEDKELSLRTAVERKMVELQRESVSR